MKTQLKEKYKKKTISEFNGILVTYPAVYRNQYFWAPCRNFREPKVNQGSPGLPAPPKFSSPALGNFETLFRQLIRYTVP